MSDLVERVAQAICDAEWGDGHWDKPGLISDTERKSYRELARAAIRIALEEAARESRPPSHMLGSADSYANGYRAACADIAAAIRGVIPNGTIPAHHDDTNAE
jgi:hypothetical protein